MEEVMPNGVMRSEDQVISHILGMDYEAECEKTRVLKRDHMQYGRNAAIKCINKVFGVDYSENDNQ
jgi:hypothetical protein